MKLRYLLAAFGSLVALNFTSAPASAGRIPFEAHFDEFGNCTVAGIFCKPAVDASGTCSDAGPCSVYTTDPTGRVTGNVWIFTFGKDILGQNYTGATADINIFDPGYPNIVNLSDHLTTIDPNNSNTSCNQLAINQGLATYCATRLIYYSLDDLGGQTPPFPTDPSLPRNTENADGTWTWGVTTPIASGNKLYGDILVPVPATLPIFASGLAVLALLGWRRKRKAQASI